MNTHADATPENEKPGCKGILGPIMVLALVGFVCCGFNPSGIPYRYSEDAKIGKATAEMQEIEKVYKKYHQENGRWPQSIEDIASKLEGNPRMVDPWGNQYSVTIETDKREDGNTEERPVVYCQPPKKAKIQWPEK